MNRYGAWTVGMVGVAALLAGGCQTTRQVSRVAADEVIDLSGRWNDTDSRLVAEEMIGQLSQAGFVSDFRQEKGRKPVMMVGMVRNESDEHIALGTFIKDIERALVNSGRVRVVADSGERAELRGERRDQQSFATEATAKRLAAETGADFMLKGALKSQVDAIQGQQVKFYQVDLELMNVENNEKAWIGNKKIKKQVKQRRMKW
jgi:penicillin-binding protein activator